MSDESFRLTALDARRYDFGSAFRGYEKARVDQFREQVAAELERLGRVNQDLDQKARNFHEQLRAFRERDRALNEALISAQQLRNESREAADREAELIRREAQTEAERLLNEARAEAERLVREAHDAARQRADQLRGEQRRLEEEIAGMDRVHRTYLAQLRLLAERQLAELSAAEERTLPPVGRRGALESGAARANGGRGSAPELEDVAATLRSAFHEPEDAAAPREGEG